MKKLLYIFLFFFLICSSTYSATDTLEGQSVAPGNTIEGVSTTDTVEGQTLASTACTASATKCNSDNGSYSLTGGDTNYQQIKAQGGEITICQIDVKLNVEWGSPHVHLEVWNTAHDTQYGSDSGSVAVVAASPGAVYEFTFATDPVVPNADFRVYIIEEDGGAQVRGTADDNCYEDSNYSLFTNSSDNNDDGYFTISQ